MRKRGGRLGVKAGGIMVNILDVKFYSKYFLRSVGHFLLINEKEQLKVKFYTLKIIIILLECILLRSILHRSTRQKIS